MGFFQMTVFGGTVRLWIVLYLIVSFLLGVGALLYWFREKLKEKWYKLRWPEKAIKCIVYYPGNMFRVFWRLIPKGETFDIDKKPYMYSEKNIVRNNDLFVKEEGGDRFYVTIEGAKYDVTEKVKLREKWSGRWPELHYKFNNPYPIDYNKTTSELKWSADDFDDFKENDLWKKLLTMDTQKNQLMLLVIIGIINAAISMVMLAKMMGWIK